jgi:putative sigma-54 modulation protein
MIVIAWGVERPPQQPSLSHPRPADGIPTAGEKMRLDVTFRNLEADDELRQLVERRVEKVSRFLRPPIEAHVVLREEKHRQIAEISVSGAGESAHVASAESEEMRTAIDAVMHKVESSLRRSHDRRVDHRRGHTPNDEDEASA